MKIWLIQIGEPLPLQPGVRKQRLTLLSEVLAGRGHEVVRWGSGFDHITKTMLVDADKEIPVNSNLKINLIKGLGYKKNISIARIADHWILLHRMLKKMAQLPSPDVVFVCTPPHQFAYEVVRFAKRRNIPVVVDIRDQWPDVFFEFLPGFLKKMAPILFRRDIKKLTFALRQATSVTAMMEDILQWGLAYAGRLKTEKDTVFYIGTEKASVPQEACLPQTLHHKLDALKEKKVFVFVGTFSNFYNPEILANVAQMFSNEGREDVVFLLAGNGEYFHNVQEKVSNLNNIYLLGWLQHEEILALLRIASVGIVPLNEARPCFPNKLFIYLSSFLPVIASTPGEFKYLMEKYDIGIYYEPGDVEGLYSSVKKLADNPGLIEQMSKNVEKIFAHLFDSETIYTKFADHIEETAEKFGEKA